MNRAHDWLNQAEHDLAAARHSAEGGYHDWAAFSAQQAAEKALKALAAKLHGSMRTHSLTDVLTALGAQVAVPERLFAHARSLDKVYLTSRYPNGFESGAPFQYFSAEDSQTLLRDAAEIVEFCGRLFLEP